MANKTPETLKDHCGVLLLEGKTYGRYKDKLLYRCIPADPNLPYVLVPYEEKTHSFSKRKINKYITFQIKESTPLMVAIITNTLGNVDELDAYTQYQLLYKGLQHSLKHLQATAQDEIKTKPLSLLQPSATLEDRRERTIISIDPEGCTDIDDAVGLHGNVLSIYIANVPFVLEYWQLWSALTDRIATIYLGEQKIPLLPPCLSEQLCSLKEGADRIAFALDIHLDSLAPAGKSILNYSCHTVLIRVAKNYAYEAPELLAREDYQAMLSHVRHCNDHDGYVEAVTDSHVFIEYCMIAMNYECSKQLLAKRRGIFRSATKGHGHEQEHGQAPKVNLPPECKHILQNVVGEYCTVANMKPHELLGRKGLPSYVHITSPIRRLVDCINMLELQCDTLISSAAAHYFLEKWRENIVYINEKNKAIRKLQNEVQLWHLYEKNSREIYQGLVFNTEEGTSTVGKAGTSTNLFKYRVYIPAIKLLTTVRIENAVTNYTWQSFTVHWFLDEIKMSKKIRLQMIW